MHWEEDVLGSGTSQEKSWSGEAVWKVREPGCFFILKGTADSTNFGNFRLNKQTGFFIGRLQSAAMFGESLRETYRAQYLLN